MKANDEWNENHVEMDYSQSRIVEENILVFREKFPEKMKEESTSRTL